MSAGASAAQTSPSPARSPLQQALDQKAPIWRRAFHNTSIAIAYIEHGQVAWTAFYGDQVPDGPPAGEKTLYSIASLTKPISAEVLLRLASAGKLSLDEPLYTQYTDPDVAGNPFSKLLTARLCLSHQSGFPNWRYLTQDHLEFIFQPGAQTGYSGEGYQYVAMFAEKKLRQSFEALAKQYVFDPIGMRDTSYTPQPWWQGRQAKPVESDARTQWNAADLLRTTVRDYAKFVISVMHNEAVTAQIAAERSTVTRNEVSPDRETVNCEAATSAAAQKSSRPCSFAAGFGLGWHIVKINGETIFDHSGSDSDVKTHVVFNPLSQTGVVIFTSGPDIDFKAINKVLAVLYPNPIYLNSF